MPKQKIICAKCGELAEHQAKGLCFNCYRKYSWKPKKKECNRCHRIIKIHARGYCSGCYNYLFHLDKTKASNHRRYHNISMELYQERTQKCFICEFDKVIQLHHLDNNHKNNSKNNLIGLCPNHHKMVHDFQYREEVLSLIREKLDEKSLPAQKIKENVEQQTEQYPPKQTTLSPFEKTHPKRNRPTTLSIKNRILVGECLQN